MHKSDFENIRVLDLAHLWPCNLIAPRSLSLAPPPALKAPVRFTTTNEDVEKCIDFTGGNDDDFLLLELLLPLGIPQVYLPTQPILQTCAAFLSQKTIHHHASRTGGILLIAKHQTSPDLAVFTCKDDDQDEILLSRPAHFIFHNPAFSTVC